MNAENERLASANQGQAPWKLWGPYLSERQWGTVREDYSVDGNAWNYFTHDQARSRAYHWGEDGLAGICDDHQILCFALALWNGRDPIIKERLFGLANSEGNHGEDVKEYYFYLDSTPTHAYLKWLYKYPQAAFPYEDLVATNRQRGKHELEYELLDTGVFDEDRYFDVFVEYAKAAPDDLVIQISVCNRGPEAAELHVLPTLWYRNTWSWKGGGSRPQLRQTPGRSAVHVQHSDAFFHNLLGEYYLYCEESVPWLFTENETNHARLFGGENFTPHVKDGINDFLVHGRTEAVNPRLEGSKAATHHHCTVAAGATKLIKLRLTRRTPEELANPFSDFDAVLTARRDEADAFYQSLTPPEVAADPDRARVMRQALAGMLWSKQYFYYDLGLWLSERDASLNIPRSRRRPSRNGEWEHMLNDDIISMPDKWEYPWYAAWDLAFHTIALSMVDPAFAKQQLQLMLNNNYLHPSGQLPAYEWNFGDVNPPVHAWATMQVYTFDKIRNGGKGDVEFLKHAFTKLLANFTWWVNRKDHTGANLFEGGFLGLDNIGVFDRSAPLPTGGHLEQADGTAWMVFFSQQMHQIAIELTQHDPAYAEFMEKFLSHTVRIASAMTRIGEQQDCMWDEEDGFFYDVLRFPDGSATRIRVRSMVGLLPLTAVSIVEDEVLDRNPALTKLSFDFLARNAELMKNMHLPTTPGFAGRYMLSILDESRLRRILAKMLDENEFLGPHGIRALSRYHLDHPYVFHHGGQEFRVAYVPGDSDTGMFGGNSNWRGPVWMPVNFLIFTSLIRLHAYYGDDFKVECPTGSCVMMTLLEVAREIGNRLTRTFLRGADGRRPVNSATSKFNDDPHWKDLILFYEYFHGDNGAGIGASHQTGWTGLIARIIQLNAIFSDGDIFASGAQARLSKKLYAS